MTNVKLLTTNDNSHLNLLRKLHCYIHHNSNIYFVVLYIKEIIKIQSSIAEMYSFYYRKLFLISTRGKI